jgi:hypothetical protein
MSVSAASQPRVAGHSGNPLGQGPVSHITLRGMNRASLERGDKTYHCPWGKAILSTAAGKSLG